MSVPTAEASPMTMDLLYVDPAEYDKLWKAVKVAWPKAKLEDVSDYIHDRRFSVEFSDEEAPTDEEWWRWLIGEGAMWCSLNFTMVTKLPETIERVKAVVKSETE